MNVYNKEGGRGGRGWGRGWGIGRRDVILYVNLFTGTHDPKLPETYYEISKFLIY